MFQNSNTEESTAVTIEDSQPSDTPQVVSYEINKSIILRLNGEKSEESKLQDVKIIYSLNFKDLEIFLECNPFEKYNNIFVIIIEEFLSLEKCEDVNEKIPQNRPILIQSRNINEKMIFYVRNEDDDLINMFEGQNGFEEFSNPKEILLSTVNDSLLNLNLQKFSSEIDNLLINSISLNDETSYRLLKLFDINFDQDLILREIFESSNLNFFLAELNCFNESEITREHFNNLSKEFQELFYDAIYYENSEILKILLKFNENSSTLENILDFAIDTGFTEIFKIIRSTRGLSINKNLISEKKKIVDEIKNFHENIKDQNFQNVKRFTENFPQYNFCYGNQKVSALEHAIDTKSFEIFAFLRAKNFYTNKKEELDAKIKNLSRTEREKILDENLKYAKEFPHAALLSKIKFDVRSSIETKKCEIMIENLSKIEEIKPILERGAESNVEISFDYGNESINSMDQSADEFTFGISYYWKNLLYVGRNKNKFRRWGTFVHELMHFVLYLIYENDCKPYCEDDKLRERQWKEIIDEVRGNCQEDTEEIIKWTFEYPLNQQEAEMAVRVCDMLANFSENSQKLQEIEKTYKKLFDFHREKVLPDLKIKKVYQIIKLNNKMGVFQKLKKSKLRLNSKSKTLLSSVENPIILSSNFSQLTLAKIFDEINESSSEKLHVKAKNIFIDPQKLNQEKLKKLIKSSDVERIIFDCTMCENLENFDFTFLNEIKSEIKIFILKNHTQKFRSLNFEFKEVKTIKEIPFLNREMSFIGKNCNLVKILPPQDICCEKNISYGEKLISKERIERVLPLSDSTIQSFNQEDLILIETPTFELKHAWIDLDEDSKNFLLNKKINFQGKKITLGEIFTPHDLMNEKILEILSGEEIKINSNDFERLEGFVERSIEKEVKLSENLKNSQDESEISESESESEYDSANEEFETDYVFEKGRVKYKLINLKLEDFFESVKGKNSVLISDNAGSGKTFVLRKIHENFIEKNETLNFISFISLKDHLKSLQEFSEESFQEFVIKIQNFNELEAEIFKQKFLKGEVKILFDGFDEISPVCKEKTLKIFKLFKALKKNQIFVTTRTHLENDLKKILKTSAYKLKILKKFEQIQVLINYWKNQEKVSEKDENFIKNCAEKLVEKISKIISSINGVIGLPLIVQNLAKIYKNKIDENFEKEIENLRISSIFKEIIENFSNVLEEKYSKIIKGILNKFSDLPNALEFLAVKYLLGEKVSENLRIYYDEDNLLPEEIARGGILRFFDGENEIKFTHQTFPEFLVANFALKIIKSEKNPSEGQIEFLMKILTEENFKISRIFLDDLLQKFDVKNLKLFTSKEKFQKDLKNNFKGLQILGREGLENLVKFILKCLESKQEFYKNFIEFRKSHSSMHGGWSHRTFLMIFLLQIKSEKFFKNFLDDIFNFYSEKVFEEFLLRTDSSGNTILHLMSEKIEKDSIFKVFWEKVQSQNLSEEKLKKILLARDWNGRNSLHLSIEKKNENSFFYLFENFYFNVLKFDEFINETDNEDKNYLHYLAEFGSESMIKFGLTKLKNNLNEEEFLKFLSQKSYVGSHFLIFAARYVKFEEVFKIIFENLIFLTNDEKYLREFLLLKDNYYGSNSLHAAIYEKNEISFTYLLEKVFCKFLKLEEFIYETDKKDKNFLHFLAQYGSDSMIKFALEKFQSYLCGEELKKFLMVETKNDVFSLLNHKNKVNYKIALFYSFQNTNSNSIEILTKFYIENFLFFEIIKILKSDLEIFIKLFENFNFLTFDEKNLKEFLFVKDDNGKNVLHWTIEEKNEILFFYLLEKIFTKFLKLEDFICETDFLGKTFLHYLAQYGSESMIKFALKMLKNNLSEELFLKFLSQKSYLGQNFLTLMSRYAKSAEVFYELNLSSLKKENLKEFLLTKDENGLNALHWSIKEKNEVSFFYLFENVFCAFMKLEEFIYETDEDGENFLHFIAKFSSDSMIKFALEKLKNYLNEKEFKKLLKSKSFDDSNLLHCAASNKSKDSVKCLFDLIRFELTDKEFKELLFEEDSDDKLPGQLSTQNSNEISDFISQLYEGFI